MPAISVLRPEEWQEVRSAVEAGVPMKEVAKRYDVEIETLGKRAQREKWLTQTAREKAIREHQAKTGANQGLSGERPVKPKAIDVIASTDAENLATFRSTTLRWGVKVAKHAEAKLSKPETISEAVQVINSVAKVHCPSDSSASVTVLFGGSPAALEARVVDVETVQADSGEGSQICDDLA